MNFGSLFAGIGGFDLGFEHAGMTPTWQVEIDDKCQNVLAHHWPKVKRFEDVKKVGKRNLQSVDLICGGFPCQPHSNAGRRQASNDPRDLWQEFIRIIRELEPRWIVAENVRGLLSSENGRFFGRILRDLAESGYDATWRVLRASSFGALHQRERIFLIANRNSERIKRFWSQSIQRVPAFSWCKDVRRIEDLRNRSDLPQPLIRRNSNGLSFRMDAIGNAVIPQIAEWIGLRIRELETFADHDRTLSDGEEAIQP